MKVRVIYDSGTNKGGEIMLCLGSCKQEKGLYKYLFCISHTCTLSSIVFVEAQALGKAVISTGVSTIKNLYSKEIVWTKQSK